LKEEIISDTTRTISYSYDVVSNRLTRNDSLEGNTVYEYDGNDRLLKEVTNGVTTTYTYDNNGNTLTKTVGTAKTTYEWDVENRLVGADTDGDGVNDVTNEYDGDGVRIRQTVAGEETRFLVDKNRDYAQVLEEYTPSKIIKASYIYGHDLISQLRNTERSFYHVDGLGSTRALTDINGLLTDAYAYEAFGEIIKQLGNTQNSYLFAGEQRDPNLGLDYLRARYYDPKIGRFVTRDTFEGALLIPISLNKYLYANANPIKYIDSSGNFSSLAEFNTAFAIFGILAIAVYTHSNSVGNANLASSSLLLISNVRQALQWGETDDDTQTYNTGHTKDVIEGQLAEAEIHAEKIASMPPEDPNENHWKKEVRAFLRRAKRLAEKRLKGQTREEFIKRIVQIATKAGVEI
jgi:RHS repeat-associated protein